MKLRELWNLFLVEDVELVTKTSGSVKTLWAGKTRILSIPAEVERHFDREVWFVHCEGDVLYVCLLEEDESNADI